MTSRLNHYKKNFPKYSITFSKCCQVTSQWKSLLCSWKLPSFIFTRNTTIRSRAKKKLKIINNHLTQNSNFINLKSMGWLNEKKLSFIFKNRYKVSDQDSHGKIGSKCSILQKAYVSMFLSHEFVPSDTHCMNFLSQLWQTCL